MGLEVDLHGRVTAVQAMDQQTINTATTTNGDAIDTALYNSLEYIVQTGTITAAGATVELEQADDSSFSVNNEDVPTAEVVGTLSTIIITSDDQVFRVGSVGKRRYQRINIVSDGTMNGVLGAVAILGTPHHQPTAEQAT